MTRLGVRLPRRLWVGVVGGVLLAIIALGAAGPDPARADVLGVDLGPIDDVTEGIKDFATAPFDAAGDAAGAVGGSVVREALEWLLGGFETVLTVALVKFLVTIHMPGTEGPLTEAAGPLIVVGGFFLIVGLISSVADGYVAIIAGTDTAARVIGQAVFRIVGLALLLAAWPWVVPLAVEMANGLSSYVLDDRAIADALRNTYAAGKLAPILWLLAVVFMAIAMLVLFVMKFVVAITFACLYVGGPALIGFGALPRIGPMAVSFAVRGVITLMVIPLAWTVVFVAWASVSGGMFAAFDGGGITGALMGPCLFIAGLVVMLAVTKRLLSMASFGLRLGVPGWGIARSAMTITAARAAGAAAAGAGAAGLGSQAAGKQPDGPAGGGTPIPGSQGRQPGPTPAPRPATQPPERRRLPVEAAAFRGTPGGPSYAQGTSETLARGHRVADSQGLTHTTGGAFAPGGQPDEQLRADLQQRAEALRARHEAITPDMLRDHAGHLSQSDRSAIAASAETALREKPGEPLLADRQFERVVLDQFASGSVRKDDERDTAAWVAAAGPETAKRAFGQERITFTDHRPDTGPNAGPPGYDGDLAPWRNESPATGRDVGDRSRRDDREGR